MANEENLKPWQPGQSGNPNGRPRKLVTMLKNEGYKEAQIRDTMSKMMEMPWDEIKELRDNPDASMLEIILANAMIKASSGGDHRVITDLMQKMFGDKLDVTSGGEKLPGISIIVQSQEQADKLKENL